MSALLPLSISLGGTEFPTRAATISGELIAFYQIGYGITAFGVGPLKEFCGVDYSTAFSLGSLVVSGVRRGRAGDCAPLRTLSLVEWRNERD